MSTPRAQQPKLSLSLTWWIRICDDYDIALSMLGKDRSPGNACAEDFSGRPKIEFFYDRGQNRWKACNPRSRGHRGCRCRCARSLPCMPKSEIGSAILRIENFCPITRISKPCVFNRLKPLVKHPARLWSLAGCLIYLSNSTNSFVKQNLDFVP